MFDNAQNQGILSRPFRDDFSVNFPDFSDFLGIPSNPYPVVIINWVQYDGEAVHSA